MNKIQDIFIESYSSYTKKYTPTHQQAKVAEDIMKCRTAEMGGRVQECEECGYTTILYNSCRNRHCPQCQGVAKHVWIDQRSKDILDAPYFHVVFTMPSSLQSLVYQNQKLLYDLMYKVSAETLLELAMDKKYLGAQIGFISVLHTWGQDLHYHPHIHVVVLAGGITEMDQWRNTSKKFFIPVRVLSKKFRGKFLYYLKRYYHKKKLMFYKDLKKYLDPKNFNDLISQCYKVDWYCYTKETFSGPLAVIKYLGRYTSRTAVSDQRIISVDEKTVTMVVKDYKNASRRKLHTMDCIEWIRRFLMHVLPRRFVRIRYYGILANRHKKTKLERCRKLTSSRKYKPKFEGLSTVDILCILMGKDVLLCPSCKKKRLTTTRSFKKGEFP